MTKKYLFWAVFFVVIMAIGLKTAQHYRENVDEAMVRGHYAFEATRANIQFMQKAKLTHNGQSFTIYRDGDYWRIKEAAEYFVNTEMLSSFYDMLNNALIISTYNLDEQMSADLEREGINIKIYSEDNHLIEDVTVSSDVEKDKSRLAYKKGKGKIYRIGPVKMFSANVQSWVPMPLLAVSEKEIAGITFNELYLGHDILQDAKGKMDFLTQLLSLLQFVGYDGIVKKEEFEKYNPQAQPLKMLIHLNSGLIYQLNLYAFSDSYWLYVDLATEKVANKDVPEQIEQLRPYYADWVFLLSNEDGKILYSVLTQ